MVKDFLEDELVAKANVFDDPVLGLYVWVCDQCGQPLSKGEACRSGLHCGPDDAVVGHAIRSIDMAYEKREGDS